MAVIAALILPNLYKSFQVMIAWPFHSMVSLSPTIELSRKG